MDENNVKTWYKRKTAHDRKYLPIGFVSPRFLKKLYPESFKEPSEATFYKPEQNRMKI
jgi:hypothetical protein